ncbi:flagellar basal body-associated FliL family protein [Aliiroseovarius sp. Z3]|uniref:flagellar basal body-associated FliL family protein n=1 Tax=Aliiroseovarius sp. Z3 TaxID=2811402 RepID=UPI0023B33AF2|nr:flagellar basal body-associated FliL family protein [Aliiroseovarius sp. Z3]MDE9449704.1 flagellar basal body-associated FliL family protein [Aliiroseovarius sp. Z3]
MTDTTPTADVAGAPTDKKSRLGAILGLILAIALGGGGFFTTYSGLIGGPKAEKDAPDQAGPVVDLPAVAFVELDPLVVSLGSSGDSRHLRFRGSLEVVPGHEPDVSHVLPRVIDVLNAYLRAVDVAMLEDPTALIELRAQMLRRVQLVTGEGRVRDLLILEFVLN